MGKRKHPSYFGDYKCHVKTNVKDSKGNFVYVDKCLKEAVENLNAVGLKTIASCCGHGIINPKISIEGLSDGKTDDLKSSDCNLAVVSNNEADCKYRDSCGLFPCNLTECDEYEPKESELAVCRKCRSSEKIWDDNKQKYRCIDCGTKWQTDC